MLQQQKGSRLREAVMVDPNVPGDRAFYDQVDATSMSLVTNRHGDTEYTDTPHRRRMVTMAMYEVADLVDRADQRRLLNDPINPYTRSMAAAANRQIDDVLFPAFTATASTGVDGTTGVAIPAANFIEADGTASTGVGTPLTVTSLILVRNLLEAAENDEGDGDDMWYACLTAAAREDLLSADHTAAGPGTVADFDFATVKALVNGQIDTFMGFKFLKSQRVTRGATNSWNCPFWVKRSMQLSIGQEPRSFMDVLPSKRHSIQVRHELDAGATRMDEAGVVVLEVIV